MLMVMKLGGVKNRKVNGAAAPSNQGKTKTSWKPPTSEKVPLIINQHLQDTTLRFTLFQKEKTQHDPKILRPWQIFLITLN